MCRIIKTEVGLQIRCDGLGYVALREQEVLDYSFHPATKSISPYLIQVNIHLINHQVTFVISSIDDDWVFDLTVLDGDVCISDTREL